MHRTQHSTQQISHVCPTSDITLWKGMKITDFHLHKRTPNWNGRWVLLPLHLRASGDSSHISITKQWTNTSMSLTQYSFVTFIWAHRYCTFIPINSTACHDSQCMYCRTLLEIIYRLSIYTQQQSRDVWMNTEYCWFWRWSTTVQDVTAEEYQNIIREC